MGILCTLVFAMLALLLKILKRKRKNGVDYHGSSRLGITSTCSDSCYKCDRIARALSTAPVWNARYLRLIREFLPRGQTQHVSLADSSTRMFGCCTSPRTSAAAALVGGLDTFLFRLA